MAEQKLIQLEISRKLKDSMMAAAEKAALNKDSKISSGRAALNALKKSSKVRPLLDFIGDNDDVGIVILEENSEVARIVVSKGKIKQEIVTENGKLVKSELTTADGTPIINEKQEKLVQKSESKIKEPKETWTYVNPTTGTPHTVGINEDGQLVIDFGNEWEVIDDEEDKSIILKSKPEGEKKKLKDLLPKVDKPTPEPKSEVVESKPQLKQENKPQLSSNQIAPEPSATSQEESKEKSSGDEIISLLKIIAKNFISLPWMARDINVARQNFIKLNKIKGIDSTNKADTWWMKESEQEKKLETEQEKYGKKSPEQIKTDEQGKEKKKDSFLKKASNSKFLKGTKLGKALGIADSFGGILKCLVKCFGPKIFMAALAGIGLITVALTSVFEGFMSGWDAWMESGSIWEAFKAAVGGFIEFITFGLIDKEMVSKFYDWQVEWMEKIIVSIGEFFGFGEEFQKGADEVKKFLGIGVKPKKLEAPEKDNAKLQQPKKNEIDGQVTVDKKGNVVEGENKRIDEETRKRAKESVSKPAPTPTKKEKGTIAGKVTGGGETPPPSTAPSKEVTPPAVGGDDKWIMDMIKKHEGVRTRPYKDSLGLWTVGVGHLIGDGKSLPPEWNREFTMAEIDALFAKDFEEHKKAAQKIPGYDKANKATQGALIDLTFNMGASWYKKWPSFIKALVGGNMQQAAEELQNSKWYQQVKGRAADIVALIKSGGSSPTAVADTKPMSDKPPSASGSTAPGGSTGGGTGGGSLGSVASVQSGVDISGFKSEFEGRVAAMAAAFKEKTGKSLLITSGYRSNEKQKELWDKALAANGGNEAVTRKKVAEPMPPLGKGKGSFHIKGLAIDINSKGDAGLNVLAGSRDAPTGWLEKFGLTRPVPGEDWHVQATGLAPTSDNPANPGKPALVADKDGKPMDTNSGKKENIPSASPTAASGGSISSASTDVASGQRQQSKPTTPVVINAPQTTTTVVNKTTNSTKPEKEKDYGNEVMGWAV